LPDVAVSQLPKRCQRLGPVRKQVEAARLISADDDPAAADQMVHPVGFDPHGGGNLRDRQGARDASGTGPPVAMQTPVPQANRSDRAGEDLWPLGSAKPLLGQTGGNVLIGVALSGYPPKAGQSAVDRVL